MTLLFAVIIVSGKIWSVAVRVCFVCKQRMAYGLLYGLFGAEVGVCFLVGG